MKLESTIRYGALVIAVSVLLFIEYVRDYALTLLIVVAFFYAVILLTICVVCPEEVARWMKRKGWFR